MATAKRKTTTAIVAGVTALALVLGGTFAWTSISQQARNEAIVDINPGGRLHDDFNGTNKDVYVENFGDELTGVPIYARIRLDQYMEIGQQAGDKATTDGKKANPVVSGTSINDVDNWTTYIPGDEDVIDSSNPFFKYWTWDLGNDENDMPVYMPTFNKNKDSLAADINGTYEGTVDGDKVHYDDYVVYTENQSLTGDATYDFDDDTEDEENPRERVNVNDPWDSADIYKESEEHTAKPISSTADVILMDEWLNMDDDARKNTYAWVYDEDGWAYWSQAIQPGETTGLLLSGIQQTRVPDDSWYYGIDVVGQFVTAGDLSAFEADGSLSDGAKELLGFAAEIESKLTISGANGILPGKSEAYSAVMTKAGIALDEQPAVTWSVGTVTPPSEAATVSDNDITVSNGTVTVAESVAIGTTFELTATVGDVKATKTISVIDSWQAQVAAMKVGTTETVEIDGVEWFVLAKENGTALLLSSKSFGVTAFEDGSGGFGDYWELSEIPGYLDQNVYGYDTDKIPSLSPHLLNATLHTESADWNDAPGTYHSFVDSIFVPSIEDFVGSIEYDHNDASKSDSLTEYYTYGDKPLITQEMFNIMLSSSETKSIYTRSLEEAWYNCYVANNEAGVMTKYTDNLYGERDVFPMLWVEYAASETPRTIKPLLIDSYYLTYIPETTILTSNDYHSITNFKYYQNSTIEYEVSIDGKDTEFVTVEVTDYSEYPSVKISADYPDYLPFTITATETLNGKVVAMGSATYNVIDEPFDTLTATCTSHENLTEVVPGETYVFKVNKNYTWDVSGIVRMGQHTLEQIAKYEIDDENATLTITIAETATEFNIEYAEWLTGYHNEGGNIMIATGTLSYPVASTSQS